MYSLYNHIHIIYLFSYLSVFLGLISYGFITYQCVSISVFIYLQVFCRLISYRGVFEKVLSNFISIIVYRSSCVCITYLSFCRLISYKGMFKKIVSVGSLMIIFNQSCFNKILKLRTPLPK